MEETRFLVLGAGVTGLSFAAGLERAEYLICEANDEIGGYCRTVKQAGFVWDYSGHFFHFRDPSIERELVEHIGTDRVVTVERCSRIFYADSHVDFPFQRNIHQLPKDEFVECLVGLVERPKGPPANFSEMLLSKFGAGITEKFLRPYNEKLYATRLERLDTEAMGRFFPHADAEEIIAGLRRDTSASYNSTFTYPVGGAVEYIGAIASKVDASRICLRRPVTSVDLRQKIAHTPLGPIRFEYLLSSAPFPTLLRLCGGSPPEGLYGHNKVLVFNLGFDRKGPAGVHWIYYPQRDVCFYRVGFYDNILDAPRMSLYVEIGYPAHEPLDPDAIEQARQRVLRDLRRCAVVTDQNLVAWHSVVLDPAYVHITQASMKAVAEERELLAARGVYTAGRYGGWTYCSIEDNIIEARALARRFNELFRRGAL